MLFKVKVSLHPNQSQNWFKGRTPTVLPGEKHARFPADLSNSLTGCCTSCLPSQVVTRYPSALVGSPCRAGRRHVPGASAVRLSSLSTFEDQCAVSGRIVWSVDDILRQTPFGRLLGCASGCPSGRRWSLAPTAESGPSRLP